MLPLDASPHQWEISVGVTEERDQEAHALFSLLGQSQGLNGVPGLDFAQPSDSVATLAAAKQVPPLQQLHVLAEVVRQGSVAGSLVGRLDVNEWAESLVHPALTAAARSHARDDLLTRLKASERGKDPLGRTDIDHVLHPDPVVAALDESIQSTAFELMPSCAAVDTYIDGYPALSISTVSLTTKPFSDFKSLVDPCQWPDCWLEARFFKSMTFVQPPQGPPGEPIPLPDHGWKGTLEEVVDWSLGFGHPDEMHTQLDVRYVWPEPASLTAVAPFQRGACTYDLGHSVDGAVTVDQGYLLVEDLAPLQNVRRFQTLKQVFLTHPPAHVEPGNVCCFWSTVSGLLQQGC